MCPGQDRAAIVIIYLVINFNGNLFNICSDKHITIMTLIRQQLNMLCQ